VDIDRPRRVADLTYVTRAGQDLVGQELPRGRRMAASGRHQQAPSLSVACERTHLGVEILGFRSWSAASARHADRAWPDLRERAKGSARRRSRRIEAARATLRPGYGHLVGGSYPMSVGLPPLGLATLSASHPRCPSTSRRQCGVARGGPELGCGRRRLPAVLPPFAITAPEEASLA